MMISDRGLKPGIILRDNYILEDVLGEGGFGITYLAVTVDTGEKVAIKEYFPLSFAMRKRDSMDIVVPKKERMDDFERGKKRFMKEAAILQEYRYLQGIVRVWDSFEANQTAYIVMDYIDGITLKEYIAGHGGMEYDECIEMLSPILKSLITLHNHSVIHRDISPDNLMVGMDNCLYLIDFGAAREVDYGKTTTILLKQGYAPPEQYLRDGEMGAWTDVYAICAVIYTALSGKTPMDAIARLQGKNLVPLSEYGVKLYEWQWNAIKKGMNMRGAQRFRNVGALLDALTIPPDAEEMATIREPEVEPDIQEKIGHLRSDRVNDRKKVFAVLVGAVALLCVIVGLAWYEGRQGAQRDYVADTGMVEDENTAGGTGQKEDENAAGGTGQKEDENTAGEKKSENAVGDAETIKLCTMPNVLGMTETAATTKIAREDGTITISVTKNYSDDVEAGLVMEQNVEPDTRYNEGAISEIVLVISEGPEPAARSSATSTTSSSKSSSNTKSNGNEAVDFFLDD
jgi:serine/threonine protein kinase